MTHAVIATTEKTTAANGGEFVKFFIHWNPNAIAVTSSGKIYVRIGDQSVPVGPDDVARIAADKGCISWEDIVTNFSWKVASLLPTSIVVSCLFPSGTVTVDWVNT